MERSTAGVTGMRLEDGGGSVGGRWPRGFAGVMVVEESDVVERGMVVVCKASGVVPGRSRAFGVRTQGIGRRGRRHDPVTSISVKGASGRPNVAKH